MKATKNNSYCSCCESESCEPNLFWEEDNFRLCYSCLTELNKKHIQNKTTKNPYQYKKTHIPKKLRWEIFNRDNFTCQYCGSRKMLEIDHLYPECKGGNTDTSKLTDIM